MAARQAHSGNDLLSGLVAENDRGDLDSEEVSATVALLFVAGSFTTTNLIGNGLLALIGHADQMRRLWHDPRLVEPAVEEMLRYDTPVQFIHRQVLDDTAVDGQQLRRGETVVVLLAAANRDPARFPEPDRLQLERQDHTHLAFAWGIHFCLGARLARMEAQLAFSGLRQRFSRLDLLEEPQRRPGLALRGLESLPMHFTPRY